MGFEQPGQPLDPANELTEEVPMELTSEIVEGELMPEDSGANIGNEILEGQEVTPETKQEPFL